MAGLRKPMTIHISTPCGYALVYELDDRIAAFLHVANLLRLLGLL